MLNYIQSFKNISELINQIFSQFLRFYLSSTDSAVLLLSSSYKLSLAFTFLVDRLFPNFTAG